jgi:bacteriocin-like protein
MESITIDWKTADSDVAAQLPLGMPERITTMNTHANLNLSGACAHPRLETDNDRELRDEELQNVTGGDCTSSTFKSVGLGLRKSAGNQASGVM